MRQNRRNCIAKVVKELLEQEAAPRAKVYFLKITKRPRQAVNELRQQLQRPSKNDE